MSQNLNSPNLKYQKYRKIQEKPNLSLFKFQPGLPTFKVLQISDTHFDPDYVVGSVANCEEPLCCRSTSTPPLVGDVVPAGKWGSYEKCDAPKTLIDNMLKSIAEEHPVSQIFLINRKFKVL